MGSAPPHLPAVLHGRGWQPGCVLIHASPWLHAVDNAQVQDVRGGGGAQGKVHTNTAWPVSLQLACTAWSQLAWQPCTRASHLPAPFPTCLCPDPVGTREHLWEGGLHAEGAMGFQTKGFKVHALQHQTAPRPSPIPCALVSMPLPGQRGDTRTRMARHTH